MFRFRRRSKIVSQSPLFRDVNFYFNRQYKRFIRFIKGPWRFYGFPAHKISKSIESFVSSSAKGNRNTGWDDVIVAVGKLRLTGHIKL